MCTWFPRALGYDLGAFSHRRPEHLLSPARWKRGKDGRLEEVSEPSNVLETLTGHGGFLHLADELAFHNRICT